MSKPLNKLNKKGAYWRKVLLKYAGLGEDEYGQFVSLEDLSYNEFVEWLKMLDSVSDKSNPFFQEIKNQAITEYKRRKNQMAAGEMQ